MTPITGGSAGAEVNMWLSDEEGAVNGAQLEVAQRIADSLPIVQTKAADYLDIFVDWSRQAAAVMKNGG